MVTKRTGKPRGAPKKHFLSDPDRHLLAFIDAEMAINGLDFESAARLSLALDSERIEMPSNPLQHARRLKLPKATKHMLTKGWLLQSYKRLKPSQTIGGRIDTLRKKSKRLESDEPAQLWLYNIRNAYILLLRYGLKAGSLILAFAEAAGERPYFEKLLEFMRTVPSDPLIPLA